MKTDKDKIISQLPILRLLGKIQGLFLLTIFVSIFILIWSGWDIAWKVGLSGCLGVVIIYFIYGVIKSAASEKFEEIIKDMDKGNPPIKSRWQQRLDEMREQRELEKNNQKK